MLYDDFINQPQRLKFRLERAIDELEYKRAAAERVTAIISHSAPMTNTHTNTHETRLIEYIDEARKVERLAREYEAARETVEAFFIDNLEPMQANALCWKYCNGKDNAEIAERLFIAYQSASNLICRANRAARAAYNAKGL